MQSLDYTPAQRQAIAAAVGVLLKVHERIEREKQTAEGEARQSTPSAVNGIASTGNTSTGIHQFC